MFRPSTLLCLAGLLVVLAAPATAADNGFYLGASVGQSQVDTGDLGEVELDDDDLGYKVFAGYRFLTFLAVEGSYVDLGGPEDDSADGRYAADVEALDVFAVGMLPLGIADLFVKAGMVSWDVELTSDLAELPDSVSEDGTDPVYGIGFQLRFSSFALRAEVEYFDIEATNDVYMVSIGGSYTF